MLDGIVNYIVKEYNFQRLAKYDGSLLSALGDKVREPIGTWRELPYHKLYFTCNEIGFLRRLGAREDFSEKEMEIYNCGRFRIAVINRQNLLHASTDLPHELIIDVGFHKGVPPKIYHKMKDSAAIYNRKLGFDLNLINGNFNGFTAGNFLDEGDLL